MSRIRLSLLSLLAVFAFSAVATAAAQAKVPTYWYKGAELNKELAITSTEGTARLWVTSLKIVIVCTAATDTGKITQVAGSAGTNKEVRVTFTGCKLYNAVLNGTTKMWERGTELSACSVSSDYFEGGVEKESAAGTVKTNLLKSKLAYLPGGAEVVDYFEPEEAGKPFVNVVLAGSSCALKGKYPVTGSAIAKVTPINVPAKVVTLTFAVTNVAAGVTQNPEFYELVEKSKVTEKDTLSFGPANPAAFESTDSVKLENGEEIEVRS